MRIHSLLQRLRSAIVEPREELSRWERLIRYSWSLLKQGARQLSQDRASMMAASLTYRTLFGLLPVTVVGAGVARALMGVERFELLLHTTIRAAGLDQVKLEFSAEAGDMTLGSWLSDIVTSGMEVNITALTWVGVLVLVYSAITLLVNIETCFNIVMRAKRGRSWVKRIPLYWFVLTFGPVLVAVAFWADAEVGALLTSMMPWDWLRWCVENTWDFLLGWFAIFLLFRYVPTSSVHAKAALVGAFVSTILLLGGKASLGLYFTHAMSIRHMYGSLGLVPVFMFWLYLMWLIILLGLQVSAILQQVALDNEK